MGDLTKWGCDCTRPAERASSHAAVGFAEAIAIVRDERAKYDAGRGAYDRTSFALLAAYEAAAAREQTLRDALAKFPPPNTEEAEAGYAPLSRMSKSMLAAIAAADKNTLVGMLLSNYDAAVSAIDAALAVGGEQPQQENAR